MDSYPVEKRAAYVWRATCIAGGEYEMHTIKTQRSKKMFGTRFAAVVIAAALMSGAAFAQEENAAYKNEAAVQAFGAFVKTTSQNGIQQGATNGAGVLGTYRFFFNDHNGVELNYGYSHNTQNYAGLGGVDSRSHEVSVAYVLRFP